LIGWRRYPHLSAPGGSAIPIRINGTVGHVGGHEVRRIFRNDIGDWCAEVVIAGKLRVSVFDYHPSVAMMRALRASGTDIADDVLGQEAEGQDIRWHARRDEDR
jgi:hypothetical protein